MLSVHHLSICFTTYDTGWIERRISVVNHLELRVEKGQVVAIAGASGSGKSLLAHAILGILPKNAHTTGEITFKGNPLTPERQSVLRGKEIALIPQSIGCLDPLMRVGRQINRAGLLSRSKKEKIDVTGILDRYNLPVRTRDQFPFQLSGGMARRVMMAMAAVGKADLIIADEPIHGLHESMAAEILSHLRELADSGKAVLMITHDLFKSLDIADKVAVFYSGTTIEEAPASDFSGNGERLRHPYSQALWKALPQNDFTSGPSTRPSTEAHLSEYSFAGCSFAGHCPLAAAHCKKAEPPIKYLNGGFVRCFHA